MCFYICVIVLLFVVPWFIKYGGCNYGCGEKLMNPDAVQL